MGFGYDFGAAVDPRTGQSWTNEAAAAEKNGVALAAANKAAGSNIAVSWDKNGYANAAGSSGYVPPAPTSGGGSLMIGAGATPGLTAVGGGLGGAVSTANDATYDPWSKSRAAAGTELANKSAAGDPSDFYRTKLESMSTGGGAGFESDDPSYQFRFNQGQQALERSLAAKGFLDSGNAAIELQQYGQGAASQEYGAQFDRMLKGLSGVESQYDSQMQRLMKMAGVDADPTAGGKLGVAQASVGVDAMKANQSYDLGLKNVGVAQQQANNSGSSMSSSIISNWFNS